MDKGPFPFETVHKAWDYFTKSARVYFARLIRQISQEDPDNGLQFRKQVKALENRDYCARLLYILNMWACEGDTENAEFDLDWAMLMAKPMSAQLARKALGDLIHLGLIETDEEPFFDEGRTDTNNRPHSQQQPPRPPTRGGDTNQDTKFDFD